jgi:hypothetical protein
MTKIKAAVTKVEKQTAAAAVAVAKALTPPRLKQAKAAATKVYLFNHAHFMGAPLCFLCRFGGSERAKRR